MNKKIVVVEDPNDGDYGAVYLDGKLTTVFSGDGLRWWSMLQTLNIDYEVKDASESWVDEMVTIEGELTWPEELDDVEFD